MAIKFNAFTNALNIFSTDVGIDLGTANTLIHIKDKGVVINEPTIVAVNTKTNQVVAVGLKAKEMYGRTPGHIQIIRPLVDGVISDFEITEEMLLYFINRIRSIQKTIVAPRVIVGVPSGITNVEMRAVSDAAKGAGAREVYLIEEPVAAALGAKLPIGKSVGSMIVDIGGGTTDIAILSSNGVVISRNLKTAGDHFTSAIVTYIRDQFKLHIGEKTAEEAKIKLASITESEKAKEMVIRGRDAMTGLPREAMITEADIREAIAGHVDVMVETIRSLLEKTPPEVLSDVMQRGIYLSGGGAQIPGLAPLLEDVLQVPVIIVTDPLRAVIRGIGIIVENIQEYEELLIENEGEFSAK